VELATCKALKREKLLRINIISKGSDIMDLTEGISKMSSSSLPSGVGVTSLLGIAFVILKLTDIIDWSWGLVTLPFWGEIAILIVIGIIWFVR